MSGFIAMPTMQDIKRLEDRISALEERWKEHPDYQRRGPTEAEWGKAIDESWAWFEKKTAKVGQNGAATPTSSTSSHRSHCPTQPDRSVDYRTRRGTACSG